LRESCGVAAAVGPRATILVYRMLKALQHRGQESAGISWLSEKIVTKKGLGLVENALSPKELDVGATVSIGHVRYSTTGSTTIKDAQPMDNGFISVAFNGTIANYRRLEKQLNLRVNTDTEIILNILSNQIRKGTELEQSLLSFSQMADGAYSVVVLSLRGKVAAMRDPAGFRPLALGRVGTTTVIASETSAIEQIGGEVIRELKAGEVIVLSEEWIRTAERRGEVHTCSFEYVYFSRPDSYIDGISVYEARMRLGEVLALKHPAEGDVVIPVPDSGRPVAIGYSRRSGIHITEGLVRLTNSMRSFIMPSQSSRIKIIQDKFGVVREVMKGRRVIVVDDSIVRGNTMRELIRRIREAGAKEVHVRIGSPPIIFPCYMGVDFPTRDELLAANMEPKEIGEHIGADSVEYLTTEEMMQAIGRVDLCNACFTGIYPLREIPSAEEQRRRFVCRA
jgi:amidophosphoribosyltransferase